MIAKPTPHLERPMIPEASAASRAEAEGGARLKPGGHPEGPGGGRCPRSARPVRHRRAAGILALVLLVVAGATPLLMRGGLAALGRFGARGAVEEIGASYEGRDGVVLQAGLNDCGPAALANLALAVGLKPPSLDSLMVLAGTEPRGTSASGLVSASRSLGVPMVFERVEANGIADLKLPFIAWVNRNHYVTVTERSPGGALTVVDPAVGRYTIDEKDFLTIWSGEAVVRAGPLDLPRRKASRT